MEFWGEDGGIPVRPPLHATLLRAPLWSQILLLERSLVSKLTYEGSLCSCNMERMYGGSMKIMGITSLIQTRTAQASNRDPL